MPTTSQAPEVSIIVPCYKTERYLPACLESLLNQDFDSLEIICVNDGSPDGCLDIIEGYADRFPGRIRLVDIDNSGVWAARMSGVEVAQGRYIGFVDSDDRVRPNYASDLRNCAVESDAEIVVCGFCRIDRESGQQVTAEGCSPRPSFVFAEDPGAAIGVNSSTWNKLYRADTLRKMQDLCSAPSVMEDLIFNLHVYLESRDSERPVVFLAEPLYNYMVRPDSAMNTISRAQVDSAEQALSATRELYERDGADDRMLAAIDAIAFEHLGVSMGYRRSYDEKADLSSEIKDTTRALDEHFPTWRDSPYICWSYARTHGPALKKLLIAHHAWAAHVMPAFLATYRFAIERMGIDIKW